MSVLKHTLAASAVAVTILGLLFATGVVSVRSSDEESGGDADASDSEASAEGGTDQGKKKRRGKRRKGKRKGKHAPDEAFAGLGYVGEVAVREEDEGKVGVTIHDREHVHAGLNLYIVHGNLGGKRRPAEDVLKEVRLLDMDGKVLHVWRADFPRKAANQWANAKFGPDGALYVIQNQNALLKLDWDSNLKWRVESRFHHDLDFDADGRVWVLDEKSRQIEYEGDTFEIWDHGMKVVTAEGEVEREYWLYDSLREHTLALDGLRRAVGVRRSKRPKNPFNKPIDLFHVNTIEFLSAPSKGLWNKGDILIAIRELDAIMVLDQKTMAPKWIWGPGELDRPHDPSLLPNGNLLMLDNGMHRGKSRIIEIDPRKGNAIVWTYEGTKEHPFWTRLRGLTERLPNDNVLISSTEEARAFEVDRAGKIVWEYWSPDRGGAGKRIAFRVRRLLDHELEVARSGLAKGGTPPDAEKAPADEGSKPPDAKGS